MADPTLKERLKPKESDVELAMKNLMPQSFLNATHHLWVLFFLTSLRVCAHIRRGDFLNAGNGFQHSEQLFTWEATSYVAHKGKHASKRIFSGEDRQAPSRNRSHWKRQEVDDRAFTCTLTIWE